VAKAATRPVQSTQGGTQGLYVQVGAYRQPQVAQSVQKKVSPLTQHPITISKTVVNNGVVHRVLIGPLPNRSDGDALALSIREQKIGDAIVKQL
ncbi:MAG TPA: SPOR domain-containing protein, partial [Pseudomonadales bacterium]|nr:SPOR domain-containing protein [Pseudomonadales bacterium]